MPFVSRWLLHTGSNTVAISQTDEYSNSANLDFVSLKFLPLYNSVGSTYTISNKLWDKIPADVIDDHIHQLMSAF